jgi:hypothetical protein
MVTTIVSSAIRSSRSIEPTSSPLISVRRASAYLRFSSSVSSRMIARMF